VECLKRYSTKSMDSRPGSTFFLEQIRGGTAGAGCVWQEKVGVELFFGSGAVWSSPKHALNSYLENSRTLVSTIFF
jgi:hypothetical protein